MIDTIQTAGPYVLAVWFGVAFGFCVCALFAGEEAVSMKRIDTILKDTRLQVIKPEPYEDFLLKGT